MPAVGVNRLPAEESSGDAAHDAAHQRLLVGCSRTGDAAVHTVERLLAEHGGVRPAHHCAPRFGRAASSECPTSDRLVGANRGRLE